MFIHLYRPFLRRVRNTSRGHSLQLENLTPRVSLSLRPGNYPFRMFCLSSNQFLGGESEEFISIMNSVRVHRALAPCQVLGQVLEMRKRRSPPLKSVWCDGKACDNNRAWQGDKESLWTPRKGSQLEGRAQGRSINHKGGAWAKSPKKRGGSGEARGGRAGEEGFQGTGIGMYRGMN